MLSDMPEEIQDLATCPFWREIIYTDGKLDPEKVANELSDYAKVWHILGSVINYQAGNRMTGCYKMYTAAAINQCIDEQIEDSFKSWLDDKIEDGEIKRIKSA